MGELHSSDARPEQQVNKKDQTLSDISVAPALDSWMVTFSWPNAITDPDQLKMLSYKERSTVIMEHFGACVEAVNDCLKQRGLEADFKWGAQHPKLLKAMVQCSDRAMAILTEDLGGLLKQVLHHPEDITIGVSR